MRLFYQSVYDKVNQENKDILDDYKMEMESKRSPKTIYQYTADIKGFLCWVQTNLKNKCVLDLKRKDFRRFFNAFQEKEEQKIEEKQEMLTEAEKEKALKLSNARINRFMSSIRMMLEYCVMEDDEYPEYQINPMKKIKGLERKTVKKQIFLTDDQVTSLINHFMEIDKLHVALWVSLSYDSAARRNEVKQVSKVGFLDNNATNTVIGKRGKKFKLLYSQRTRDIAKKYFEKRGEDDIGNLWVIGKGENKKPVQYSTFYDWACLCSKYLNEVENTKKYKFGSHVFRHSALERYSDGTHYYSRVELKAGKISVDDLQTMAHHKSSETTKGYLKDKSTEKLSKIFKTDLD